MRLLLYLLFPCLLLSAGRELIAQGIHDSQQETTNKYYRLSDLTMSGDGKWLTIRKSYDLNQDTVLILSSRQPEQPVTYRTKIRSIVFLSNENLLMLSSQQAELLNLIEQTSIYFKGVKLIEALRGTKQFLLHYNEEEENRLELRTLSGELLSTINNVSSYYTSENLSIYAITEEENSKNEVILMEDRTTERVYVTSQNISYVEADPGGHGIMIYEQNNNPESQVLKYLDIASKTIYSLKDVLSVPIQNGFREVIREGTIYYLRLWAESKADSSLADIWYGNDNQLEEKFYPSNRNLRYVWEPKEKKIRQIGNNSLTTNLNIGSDRYFLSFDPSYFQDYTTESVPLQLCVYDRIKDCYSILDTIDPVFYISGNGIYGLSPKDRQWNLYHIPSGNKKHIYGKGTGAPWFTNDCKIVLLEGEDALWKIELKRGVLVEESYFKGYQTKIINGEWEVIRTRQGRFCKQHVNIQEPLVIRLFDPKKNLTSYTLWTNGKSEIIIPPTTKHIQHLKYNKSFDCFFWVEEDYNLPPRLVFKKMGEREKILYQSNKADKAILSLKQEIISYTSSNGIPMKGILYYPLAYVPFKKYPMVVHIYEKQNELANRYPYPSYYGGLGFNIRLLIDKGYFVFLPDILIQGRNGPGLEALDCVNNALDAIEGNLSIDQHNVGLIGHSFGGYETDFIATHSTRFAAYVSGSGHSDILWAYHSFNYNFTWPDHIRIEDNNYKFGVPFSYNKTLYFLNNPIYFAENVNAPVLLWSGLKDQNVTSDHSMAFYNALRRNQKNVIAIYYKDQGHSLQKPLAQFDLTSRIIDWFDYHLNDSIEVEWIREGISKRRAP